VCQIRLDKNIVTTKTTQCKNDKRRLHKNSETRDKIKPSKVIIKVESDIFRLQPPIRLKLNAFR